MHYLCWVHSILLLRTNCIVVTQLKATDVQNSQSMNWRHFFSHFLTNKSEALLKTSSEGHNRRLLISFNKENLSVLSDIVFKCFSTLLNIRAQHITIFFWLNTFRNAPRIADAASLIKKSKTIFISNLLYALIRA